MGRPGEPSAAPVQEQQPAGEQHPALDHGASCSSVLTAAEGNPAAVGSQPGRARQAVSGGSGPAAAEDGSVRFSVLRFGDGSIFRAPVRHVGGGSSLALSPGRATQKEVIDICDSDTDNADLLALPAPASPAAPAELNPGNHVSGECLEDDLPGDPPQSPPRARAQSRTSSRPQTSPVRRTGDQPATSPTLPRVLKRIRHPAPEDGGEPAAQRPAVGVSTPGRAGSGGAAAEGGEPSPSCCRGDQAPSHCDSRILTLVRVLITLSHSTSPGPRLPYRTRY